uniref:Uncharacterized protein n=1 Tax=Rhizochromulina marina TaxID=1034831 RepID=A0A7S2R5J1_9STRA
MDRITASHAQLREVIEELCASKFVVKLTAACQATGSAAYAWGEVVMVLGGPPARSYWRWQTSLSKRGLLTEAGVFGGLVVLVLIHRFLRRTQPFQRARQAIANQCSRVHHAIKRVHDGAADRYRRGIGWVTHKSRLLAACVPHVFFILFARFVLYVVPSLMDNANFKSNVETGVILWRVLWTILAIEAATGELEAMHPDPTGETSEAGSASAQRRRRSELKPREPEGSGEELEAVGSDTNEDSMREDTKNRTALTSLRGNLMFWVVFAFVIAFHRLTVGFPLVSRIASFFTYHRWVRASYAFFLIWLQLPIGGLQLAYDFIVPAVEQRVGQFSTPVSSEQRNIVFRMLVYTGVLSQETSLRIQEVSRDGWILLALAFLFSAGFMTEVGCLLAGLCYPAMCSAKLLGAVMERVFIESQVRWLKYWAVYAVTFCFGLSIEAAGIWRWVLFGNHVHLVFIVYLQLPYFRGALLLYDKTKMALSQLLDLSPTVDQDRALHAGAQFVEDQDQAAERRRLPQSPRRTRTGTNGGPSSDADGAVSGSSSPAGRIQHGDMPTKPSLSATALDLPEAVSGSALEGPFSSPRDKAKNE